MRAVRIHQYGSREVLRLEEAPMPSLEDGDVLVKVVAAGVNPVDWKIREGHLKEMLPHALPLTLGWDVSGVVSAVGAGVADLQVGDAVYGRPDIVRNGSYAEYVAVRASELAAKPATIAHATAASLPLAGITAWEVIVRQGRVQPGQRVLVHAGAGGVGSLAIQLAKWRGAHVIATASAANRDLVLSLGADEVIDYRSTPFQQAVRDVDLVFDTLGGTVQALSWQVLKPDGLLVSIVSPPAEQHEGRRGAFVFIGPDAEVLRELAALVDDGVLRPLVGAEFALADVAAAHELSESGRARGKIVLHVGTP
ncbi:NADP-dependent oxidoreductase [Chitiniphilus eburneus]|uniref:NADP-dependent oxidoreductase n=1 Tax=Chitiniphilus eburneus TaxID=2571148 RepID=A0A4U0Q7C3_9NEIS|nr:NADP-dependent oxidoreductase [Chitiniphilus eburneus]TJZ76172.1 NADP-dependent oxidoreductase [Chitiniphilus eburneus]